MRPAELRIRTGARLHFGLLDVVAPFGGLGMMVDAPETVVKFTASEAFSADASIAARAAPIAQRVRSHFQLPSLPRVQIELDHGAPAHSGFGSGTQLSMAIAEGLCRCIGQDATHEPESRALIRELSDRGKRSAVGVHGYFEGGLVYEEATEEGGINQVVLRVELDDAWRVVLIRPKKFERTVAGADERHRFSELKPAGPSKQAELRSLITGDILPAAEQGAFKDFAKGIQQYNRASGMLFSSVQEGAYNGPVVSELIKRLEELGIRGVGQSSWGPGVFAWCSSESRANQLQQELRNDPLEVQVTRPRVAGREVYFLPSVEPDFDSGH